jgi:hypothetical protein
MTTAARSKVNGHESRVTTNHDIYAMSSDARSADEVVEFVSQCSSIGLKLFVRGLSDGGRRYLSPNQAQSDSDQIFDSGASA